MGECLLKKNGVTVDSTAVTATESDVLIGKTYMKSNGDKGVGTKQDNGSPQKTLPLNGSIVLPSGYYGGGSVKSSVPEDSSLNKLQEERNRSGTSKDSLGNRLIKCLFINISRKSFRDIFGNFSIV